MTTLDVRARTAGTGARVAAVLAALVLGLLAAKLASRALPVEPDTAAVAAVAYPNTAVHTERDPFRIDDEPGWVSFLSARDDAPAQWMVAPRVQPVAAAETQWRASARQRFTDAGWTIGDGIPDSVAFFATKDNTRAAVYGNVMDPDGFNTFTDVGAVQPWWVSLIALGGGVAGGLLGWLAAGWTARRAARRSSAGRAGVRELTVIGFVLLLPFTAQTAIQLVADASRAEQPWQPSSTLLDLSRWPGTLGVLLLLIALALAVGPVGAVRR
jgi:hypothetical protein